MLNQALHPFKYDITPDTWLSGMSLTTYRMKSPLWSADDGYCATDCAICIDLASHQEDGSHINLIDLVG